MSRLPTVRYANERIKGGVAVMLNIDLDPTVRFAYSNATRTAEFQF
jgi:hypothetical protein